MAIDFGRGYKPGFQSIIMQNNMSEEIPVSAAASVKHNYLYSLLAAEISSFTRYYDQTIQWRPRPNDSGTLLEKLDCPSKTVANAFEDLPQLPERSASRTAILLNGTLNHHFDIQMELQRLHERLNRFSRLVVVAYNPYLSWAYRLANALGLRTGELPSTFVTKTDLANISKLANYEVVRLRPVAFFPWKVLGLGSLLNFVMPLIPGLRQLSLANLIILRPFPRNPNSQGPLCPL